jgi:ABC-type molybdate transport system substrate-binding protein
MTSPAQERILWSLAALAAAVLSACHKEQPVDRAGNGLRGELVIFHAGSLAVPLREISALFRRENCMRYSRVPPYTVSKQPCGVMR